MSSSIASRVQQMQYDDVDDGWLRTAPPRDDASFHAPARPGDYHDAYAPAYGGAGPPAADGVGAPHYRGSRRPPRSSATSWTSRLTEQRPPWLALLVVAGVGWAVYTVATKRSKKAAAGDADEDEDDEDFLFQPF